LNAADTVRTGGKCCLTTFTKAMTEISGSTWRRCEHDIIMQCCVIFVLFRFLNYEVEIKCSVVHAVSLFLEHRDVPSSFPWTFTFLVLK